MAPPAPAAPCRAPAQGQGCGSASACGDSPPWGCGRSRGQCGHTPTSPWPPRALREDEGPRRARGWFAETPLRKDFLPIPSQATARGAEPGCSGTSANSPMVGCGVRRLTARLSFRTLSRGAEQAAPRSQPLVPSCGAALCPVSCSETRGCVQPACASPAARFLQPERAPRALQSGSRTALPTRSTGLRRDGHTEAGGCMQLSAPRRAPAARCGCAAGEKPAPAAPSGPERTERLSSPFPK